MHIEVVLAHVIGRKPKIVDLKKQVEYRHGGGESRDHVAHGTKHLRDGQTSGREGVRMDGDGDGMEWSVGDRMWCVVRITRVKLSL